MADTYRFAREPIIVSGARHWGRTPGPFPGVAVLPPEVRLGTLPLREPTERVAGGALRRARRALPGHVSGIVSDSAVCFCETRVETTLYEFVQCVHELLAVLGEFGDVLTEDFARQDFLEDDVIDTLVVEVPGFLDVFGSGEDDGIISGLFHQFSVDGRVASASVPTTIVRRRGTTRRRYVNRSMTGDTWSDESAFRGRNGNCWPREQVPATSAGMGASV